MASLGPVFPDLVAGEGVVGVLQQKAEDLESLLIVCSDIGSHTIPEKGSDQTHKSEYQTYCSAC